MNMSPEIIRSHNFLETERHSSEINVAKNGIFINLDHVTFGFPK